MSNGVEKKLLSIDLFSPWIIYYLLCTLNCAYLFYTGFITSIPFGLANNPVSILIFIISYLYLCIYIINPTSLISKDEQQRVAVIRKVFLITFILNCVLLFFLFLWSTQSENFAVGIYIILLLQSFMFKECIVAFVLDTLPQGPLEVYVYITSNMSGVNIVNFAATSFFTFEIVKTTIFISIYSTLVFFCGFFSVSDKGITSSIFQIAYIIWTLHAMLLFCAGYICISFLLKLTSPTMEGTSKRRHLIMAKCIENIGVVLYLSFLSFLFQLLNFLSILVMFSWWPEEKKEKVACFFKTYFTILHCYYLYRIKTVLVASILFDLPPKDAIVKLLQVTNNNNSSFANAIQNGETERLTNLLSTYFIICVITPIFLLRVLMETFTLEGNYERYLLIVLWSTYPCSTIGYLKTEIIHTSILLAYTQKISFNQYWTEEYLATLQLT